MRNNLIQLREKLGMNQSEFGKLINLTKQKVCNLEKGRIQGSADTWITIGIQFNLTVQQLKELKEVS